MATVRELQASLPVGFRVAVNCSPRQLSSDDAIDHMIAESQAWQPLLGILRLVWDRAASRYSAVGA